MNQELKRMSQQMADPEQADRTLFEFLKPKAGERYSKLEAFCDLLSRGKSGPYILNRYGEQLEILPGQFVTTISALSKKWQWQRATVRLFLEGLVALDQLEEDKFYSSIIFTLKRNMKLSLKVQDTEDILDFCCMQFSRFTHGRVSAREVADSYSRYYGLKMEIALEKKNNEQLVQNVYLHQAYMFETLVLSMSSKELREQEAQKSIVQMAQSLFGRECLWDWQKVIGVLSILGDAFKLLTPPSLLEEQVVNLMEGEKKKLDFIYSRYVCDTSPYLRNSGQSEKKPSDASILPGAGTCTENQQTCGIGAENG